MKIKHVLSNTVNSVLPRSRRGGVWGSQVTARTKPGVYGTEHRGWKRVGDGRIQGVRISNGGFLGKRDVTGQLLYTAQPKEWITIVHGLGAALGRHVQGQRCRRSWTQYGEHSLAPAYVCGAIFFCVLHRHVAGGKEFFSSRTSCPRNAAYVVKQNSLI